MKRIPLLLVVTALLVLLVPAWPAGAAVQPISTPANLSAVSNASLPFDLDGITASRNDYRPVPGGLRADNGRVQADLSSWGFTFGLYRQDPAAAAARLGYRLTLVQRGDTVIYAAPPEGGDAPAVQDTPSRAGFAHPEVVESYVVSDYQVEQLFTIRRPLPGSGDLVLAGTFSTTLSPVKTGLIAEGTVQFPLAGGGELSYGQAAVVDAAGRVAPVAIRLEGSQVQLVVSGAWLDAAAYPVVVDPLLGSELRFTTADTNQETPVVVAKSLDGTGEDDRRYLAAWADATTSNGYDIYAAFVKADGTMKDTPFVVATGSGDQKAPAVAYDATNNRFMVVYEDDALNRIRGIIYNAATGAVVYDKFNISTSGTSVAAPAVAAGSDYLVTWQRTLSGVTKVYSRVVKLDSTFYNVSDYDSGTATDSINSAVAMDSVNSRFFVTYENGGNVYGLTCTRDANGDCAASTPFQISSSGTANQTPALAVNTFYNESLYTNGEVFVVWERDGSIMAQRYHWNSGAGAYETAGSNVCVSPPSIVRYSLPSVAYQPHLNEYVVAWRIGTKEIGIGQVTARGGRVASMAISGSSTDLYQRSAPVITFNHVQDRYYIVWQGQAIVSDGGGMQYEIYGRGVNFTSLLGTSANNELRADTAYGSDIDQHLVAWLEESGGTTTLYAQRLYANGTPLGTKISVYSSSTYKQWVAVAYGSNTDTSLRTWLIAWEEENNQRDICLSEVKPDGTVKYGRYQLSALAGSVQSEPAVVYDPTDKRFMVTWYSNESVSSSIRGSIVVPNTSGNPSVPYSNFEIAAPLAGYANTTPAVSVYPSGVTNRFLVTWWTSIAVGGQTGLVARTVGSTGGDLGTIRVLYSTASPAFDSKPSIAFATTASGSNYLVVFLVADGVPVYANRVSVSGVPQWTACAISTLKTGSSFSSPPDVATVRDSTTTTDYFQVVYRQENAQGVADVRGRLISQLAASCPGPTAQKEPILFSSYIAPQVPTLACGSNYTCLVGRGVGATNGDIWSDLIFR